MLYIFDKDDNFKNIITEDTGLIDTWFKDYQNHLIDEPFVFHVDSESELLPLIVAENQVAFKHTFNALQQDVDMLKLMRIKEIDEIYNSDGYMVKVTCEPSWLELYDHFIEDRRIDNGRVNTALTRALNGSRWVGQVVGDGFGNGSTNFYWIDAVEALFKIAEEWGGVLHDYITLDDNNEIATRIMYLLPRLGRDNGLLIQPDYNAELIERRTLSYPVTAIWGQGASLEIEDDEGELTGGHTRYITFEDVEWKKSNGDPVDKPKGQKWIGDPDALTRYGYLKADGSRMHRFGHFSNQDYETPEELLWATWEALQKEKEPEIYHEATIYEVDKPIFLGDTGTVLDRHYGKPIEVQSQITGLEYDILRPTENVNIVLGNYKDMSRDPLEDEIDEIKKEQGRPPIINDNSFPDVKPGTPVNVEAVGMFRAILVSWEYDSKIYMSHYEVYASQMADFVPDAQFLVYRGRVSSFGHEVGSNETWYYRVRAVNTHGTTSEFSVEVSATTTRIDFIDMEDEIKKEIQDAHDRAEEAYDNANLATNNATEAINIAQDGFDKAQQAIDDAGSADSKANQAISDAQGAFDKAQESIEGLTTLTEFVDENTGEITSIKGSVQGLKASVTDLDDNVASLQMTSQSLAGRLTDAEGNLTTISATVDGLQTQVSDVEGNVSTVTQLANVLERRMTDSEGNINTLQSTASSLTSRIGLIEDWEIGARNYTLKSDEVVEYESSARYSYSLSDLIKNHPSKKFSVSFDMEYTGTGEISRVEIYLWEGAFLSYAGGRDSGNRENTPIGGLKNEGKWTRYEGTLYSVDDIAEHDNITIVVRLRLSEGGFSSNARIQNMKVEKGNKPSDWSPAPEDTDQKFSVINQAIDSISTRVQNAEGDITTVTQLANGLQSRVSDAEGNITSVTQLANGMQTRLTNAEGDVNELTSTASSLVSRISSVEDWEIGGSNLLIDSNDFGKGRWSMYDGSQLSVHKAGVTVSEWGTDDATQVRANAGEQTAILKTLLQVTSRSTTVEGEFYTLSFYIKNVRDVSMSIRVNGLDGLPIVEIGANQVKRVVVSGERTSNNLQIQFRSNTVGRYVEFIIWRAQIEKGNKVTDWSPAPEDTYSQISQLSNAINLRVKKDELLSQINLDTSGVLISGKKLILDGDTTVNGNFRVKDANIAELSAGKLTGGTADFAKFSAININANSINSGTLSTDVMRVRGGSTTEYALIDGSEITTRGKYTRTWFGETQTHDVGIQLRYGRLRFHNYGNRRNLYFSDLGISTYFGGSDNEEGETSSNYGSGTIEFFSYRHNSTIRGLTMYSNNGVVALESEQRNVVIAPYYSTRASGNKFSFSVKPTDDGYFTFGNSGIRLQAKGSSVVYATNGNGDKASGSFYGESLYGDLKPRGTYAYVRAPRLRIIDHNSATSSNFGDLQLNEIMAHSIRLNAQLSSTSFYVGVSDGEMRVTNNLLWQGSYSETTFRPVRARSFIEQSSKEYKTDIQAYEENAMDVIRDLTVVNYRFKDDIERGVNLQQIGFISEDSPAIATADNMAIQTTKLASYLTKGIQELDLKIDLTREELVLKITDLESRLNVSEQRINELESAA